MWGRSNKSWPFEDVNELPLWASKGGGGKGVACPQEIKNVENFLWTLTSFFIRESGDIDSQSVVEE